MAGQHDRGLAESVDDSGNLVVLQRDGSRVQRRSGRSDIASIIRLTQSTRT